MKNLNMIYLKEVLEDYTDENHHLTQEQIADYIEKLSGARPERKTIGRNIARLREDYGMDIKSNGKGAWLASREFDAVELRLLIDSIMANRNISEEDTKRIIEKLEDQASVYFTSQSREVFMLEEKSTINVSTAFDNIEIVARAIKERKAVSFEYIKDYYVLQDPILKPGNGRILIHPLCIIFLEHKYYAVSRHMGDEFDGKFKGTLDYVPLHSIKNLNIVDAIEKPEPLSKAEKDGLKQMLMGEKLHLEKKKTIRFIAPRSMAPLIEASFGVDVRMLEGIHGGEYDSFLPNMTKCLFEVTSDERVFWEFYCTNMLYIKVLSPNTLIHRINRNLISALKNNEN